MRVTNEAKAMLAEIERPEGQVLRLEPTSANQLGLVMGEARVDDLVIDDSGQDLLHVAAAVTALLEDAVIDRVETPEGARFGIQGAGGPSAENGARA